VAEPLYMSYRMGGVNLLPMNLPADVSQLVHGIRLFQSTTVGTMSHSSPNRAEANQSSLAAM
jgi:hypothetical protein